MSGGQTLGQLLRRVSNWRWDEFVLAEYDDTFTTNEALIFALIRACAMEKLDAIKLTLNRLDGRLKTPIKVEYPKIYYLFPNATTLDSGGDATFSSLPEPEVVTGELATVEDEVIDLPSLSLRQTLAKMSDYPRQLPQAVADLATETQQWLKGFASEPSEIPLVKSVVAAHLLLLGQKSDISAINEIFDSIDGKLAETIQLLGEDIYITSYASRAPEGAAPNDDGILQAEATMAQDLWAHKLGRQMGNY